jgi:hypothetical protein
VPGLDCAAAGKDGEGERRFLRTMMVGAATGEIYCGGVDAPFGSSAREHTISDRADDNLSFLSVFLSWPMVWEYIHQLFRPCLL